MAAALPLISDDVVDSVFSLLSKMEVELDADPLQFGPKRLNSKVAQARGMLTECEGLFLKISQWLQKYRAALRTLETVFDLDMKHLFANDPEVRAGRNVADRDALATMKLRGQASEVAVVQQTREDLEAMLTVIKAKRADLKDVQGRLRDQMKLCNEEITLGARWGSKPRPDLTAPDLDSSPDVDRQTLRDLHDMFMGLKTKEPDLGLLVPPAPLDAEVVANIEEALGVEPETDPQTQPETPALTPTPTAVPITADSLLDLLGEEEAVEEAVEEADDAFDSLLEGIGVPNGAPEKSLDNLLDDLDL
jgi:hypothetical protein